MTRSPGGLQTRRMLPGVHKVRMKLAAGAAEYWYAWRGGPRILACKAKTDEELQRLVERAAAQAAVKFAALVQPRPSLDYLSGLIAKYLAHPDYLKLGDRTRADLSLHLGFVRTSIGDMPLEAMKSDGARKALLNWRDGFAKNARTADHRVDALARVLAWAKARGDIPQNPLEKWPRLYSADRAAVIWTKPLLIKLLKSADPEFRRAVLLGAFTGLRLADLVRLTWSQVGKDAITVPTRKSNGQTVSIIPITPKARAILNQIGRREVGAVLVHTRGDPWTGWGLQTAMQRRKAALGIKDVRLHDLRGTAATNFIRAGLPLQDVASIMGWTTKQVEQIARRYVTGEALAAGMLERLRKNRRGT
jgi:integrase